MIIRKYKFDFSNLPKFWFFDKKLWTLFWNANSVFFEHAEKAYISTLQEVKIDDEQLMSDINVTKAQESWHKFNHVNFNKYLSQTYDIVEIDRDARRITVGINFLPLRKKILYCYTFETGLVYLAKVFFALCKNRNFKQNSGVEFWIWHAEEEIEHGYVAKKLKTYYKLTTVEIIFANLLSIFFYSRFILKSVTNLFLQEYKNSRRF